MLEVKFRISEDDEYIYVKIYVPGCWLEIFQTLIQNIEDGCECHNVSCHCPNSADCGCKPFWLTLVEA